MGAQRFEEMEPVWAAGKSAANTGEPPSPTSCGPPLIHPPRRDPKGLKATNLHP